MDTPEKVVGILISVILACVAWWTKTIWSNHKETRDELDKVKLNIAQNYRTRHEGDMIKDAIFDRLDRVGNIELLLAQQYVTKIEMKDFFQEVFTKLDKLETKLDRKQDKP